MKLTEEQLLVNRVRVALGKDPLYMVGLGRDATEPAGGYLWKEVLCKLANPDCARCGGAGYYDGWDLDERCPCTGLPPKGKRGTGKHSVGPEQRRLFRQRSARL